MIRLKKIFEDNFENEQELGHIAHSSCSAEKTLVFDFDSIKLKFCNILGIQQLKSVDAVCFANPSKILFIEMKRFDTSKGLSCKDYIDSHLELHQFPHKIVDSMILLLSICGYYKIDTDFYSYILNNTPTPKIKPILLVDLTNRQYLSYVSMSAINRSISFTKRVDSPVSIFNCLAFDRYIKSA